METIANKPLMLRNMGQLTEQNLVNRIILPLLEKMGFTDIELTHGTCERGKDIVCLSKNEIDELDILAIQVKKLKFSGNIASSGNIIAISNQLSQCFSEPIKLKDGTERFINRAWFISPFPLNISALENSFSAYVGALKRNLLIIDGTKLLNLVLSKAPELLVELGDQYSYYLEQVERDLNLVHESSVFRLKDKLCVIEIYINIDFSVLPREIINLVDGGYKAIASHDVTVQKNELSRYEKFLHQSEQMTIADCMQIHDPVAKFTDEMLKSNPDLQKIECTISFDGEIFLSNITKKAQECISAVRSTLNKSNVNWEGFGENLKTLCEIKNLLQDDVADDLCKIPLQAYRKLSHKHPEERYSLNVEDVLESKTNFQLVGHAGAGKTTFLRILGYTEAKRRKRLPLFLQLSKVQSEDDLYEAIVQKAKSLGLVGNNSELEKLLQEGQLLLLLDGIDESSCSIESLRNQIEEIACKYKKSQLIVSSRYWASIEHSKWLATVSLLPFTKDQIIAFFDNWFKDDKQQSKVIVDHLDSNPDLYTIISTPLLATIFAVIKMMGGKLPSSLIELHEERLRVFLYDWDSVKGINRTNFSINDKRYFLAKLGFMLHKNKLRTIQEDTLLKFTQQTVGVINTKEDAVAFIGELHEVNNLIFKEPGNEWGLGHLQYQEYLAAVEIIQNPRNNLEIYIDDGWWSLVLEFYASSTRDISHLIEKCYAHYGDTIHNDPKILHKLTNLLHFAPNTDAKLKPRVRRDLEQIVGRR